MADARAYNALYGGVLDEQPLSYRTPLRQPNALMGPPPKQPNGIR
jgi:hypothetical protein